MGKRTRARRDDRPTAAPLDTEEVARLVRAAATEPRTVAERLDELDQVESPQLGVAADLALHRELDVLWTHGWLPVDVVEISRRQLGESATTLVVDAIAAEALRYPAATVHQRWLDQLTEIGAEVWWNSPDPLLEHWAARHIELRRDALAVVVDVLGLFTTLPPLPVIVARPGTAHAVAEHAGVDRKVLKRVRGLLAKAESTQFPDEAEALSAKAQELMNRHAFERAALDARDHVPQEATSRRMWLEKRYFTEKAQLVNVVADANRSRAVSYQHLGFVALVGDELDLEIVEVLSTSLLVQATRAMVASGDGARRGDEERSRGYRQSFLVAYAHRVGERLRAATEVHEEDDRLLPVLSERRQAVDQLFETLFTRTVAKSVSVRSEAGWHAGRAAANTADLGVRRRAVSGG
ncbi:DUF2786 domain-containing protein [Umezawaea beigongshangensis]|uniref:DUF2786 domain-containing protein n=1 Tax=Umezawaea beigongshangensis TaxID=2780383 RepID=UPI0018F26B0E|nr:DUF2786 domain-containing protein [Umezawaea beigongshangensis]